MTGADVGDSRENMRRKLKRRIMNAKNALNLKNLAVNRRYAESKELLILNLKRALRNSGRLNSEISKLTKNYINSDKKNFEAGFDRELNMKKIHW